MANVVKGPVVTDFASQTVTSTERDFQANSTSLGSYTSAGDAEYWVSLANMAAGDQYRFRVYEKVNSGGSQEVIWETTLTGAQPGPLVTPRMILGNGYVFTGKKLAGTDRVMTSGIRYYDYTGTFPASSTPDLVSDARYIVNSSTAKFRFRLPATGRTITDCVLSSCKAGASSFTTITATSEWTLTELGNKWYEVAIIGGSTTTTDGICTLRLVDTTDGSVEFYESFVVGGCPGDVRQWIGTAPNGLISSRVDVNVGAMQADTLTSSALATSAVTEIADAIFNYVVENSKTFIQYVRVMKSALAAKAAGFNGATRTYRDDADTKPRITATVDATGRTAVTIDGT